ncbi:MAG: type II secretion system protein, partial [Sedimentisphaerales bacterium]
IMKRAFSLAELMIVLAILGILAAIVLPYFRSHTTQAKEAVAKDHLRILRSAIELYPAQHGGVPPGYKDNNPQTIPSSVYFQQQVILQGNYLRKTPENPFNKLDTMNVIGNNETFPAEATGNFGWVYKPATKTIRLDWPGTDKDGIRYYDY